MSFLDEWRDAEQRRIQKLFDIAEKFTGEEIERLLENHMASITGNEYLTKIVLRALENKIRVACNMESGDFKPQFHLLSDSTKRCLLVTLCNDLAKLNTVSEFQIFNFLESQLNVIQGVSMDSRPSIDNDNQGR